MSITTKDYYVGLWGIISVIITVLVICICCMEGEWKIKNGGPFLVGSSFYACQEVLNLDNIKMKKNQ